MKHIEVQVRGLIVKVGQLGLLLRFTIIVESTSEPSEMAQTTWIHARICAFCCKNRNFSYPL